MPKLPSDDEAGILAVSLFDLERVEPGLRQRSLTPRLDLSGALLMDPDDPKSRAVRMRGELLAAAFALDLARSEARRAEEPLLRAWVRAGERWRLLPDDAVLTRVMADERWGLDPRWFPDQAPAPAYVPLPPATEV